MADPIQTQINRLQSQQSLRQQQGRNALLQRQQQVRSLESQQEQLQQQERRNQELQRQQQQASSSQAKELQKQEALRILIEKGKGSSALYSLTPQERAEVEAIASEIKGSRERSAGIVAVSKAERALSASLVPELRADIYKQAASGATTITLPDLNARFNQLSIPQYTPAGKIILPQKQDKYFYTPAPLSVTNPSEYRRQQISKILQTPERSFKNLISYSGEKVQSYAEATRDKGYPTLESSGVLPYTPAKLKTPEQIRAGFEKGAEISSYFIPVVGQSRLISLGLSATGKTIEGKQEGIKEAGLLLGTGFIIKGASGLKNLPEDKIVSTKFLSQRQSSKSTDINLFAKELSEVTSSPVVLSAKSRIQSGVIQIKTKKGISNKYTYQISEESLAGGFTESTGGRLIKGFIKDSEGKIVSKINAVSTESSKDLVSRILTTSITDTVGSGRQVQTIAEKIVSTETKPPKGVAFIVKKPKGMDIIQTPKSTLIDVGKRNIKVKYFEDIGVAVSRKEKTISSFGIPRATKPQDLLKSTEIRFDEGVFGEIFKRKGVEKTIAKTYRVTIKEPLNILQGFEGRVVKTSLEREFGSTSTKIIPVKSKPTKKGVSMNTFLGQFYGRINRLNRERALASSDKMLIATDIKLSQLKDLKFGGEGTTALLIREALPKSIKSSAKPITSTSKGVGVSKVSYPLSSTQTVVDFEQIRTPSSAPSLDFVNLGFKTDLNVKGISISISKQPQIQLLRSSQEKILDKAKSLDLTRTQSQVKTSERVISLVRNLQAQRKIQELRLQQRQLQRQSNNLRPRTSTKPVRIIPFPLLSLSEKFNKPLRLDALDIGIEVRRKGKFQVLGTETTLERAIRKGSRIADVTLARSFRLRRLDTGELLDVSQLPLGFRRSKREARTFVEESKFALSTGGEKGEIKYFKNVKSNSRRRFL